MLIQVFVPCFSRKTCVKRVLCSQSTAQALTWRSCPIQRSTVEHCHHPSFQAHSEERPGCVNYWIFSIPTEVQAGQDHVVPQKLRAKVNEEDEKEKPAVPSLQPCGLYCCLALNKLAVMVVCDTPVILLLMFFTPHPPHTPPHPPTPHGPCFPRGWNRLFEGWYLQKRIVIDSTQYFEPDNFQIVLSTDGIKFLCFLPTFSLFSQDINSFSC